MLSLREKEFIEAARMTGAGDWRIMRSHLLPHLVAPIIVYSTLDRRAAHHRRGRALVPRPRDRAADGELGQPARRGARPTTRTQPWIMLFPGLAILFTTLAFNLLGDALRDAFDPRSTL